MINLEEKLQKHATWLEGKREGERANISGADLRYANLSGANLSDADLSGADLRYADLSGADLSGANLRYADISGAYLRYAKLSGADLRYAKLSGADLRYANLSGANLSDADLSGADISGADLSGADLSGAKSFYFVSQRSDGYSFYLVKSDLWRIQAGCRDLTIQEYKKHVLTYDNERKAKETLLILKHAEELLKAFESEF